MSLKNLLIVALLCSVAIIFVGCVDVPDQAPEFPDYRTNTRFVQADGSLGAIQVLVEPTTGAGVQPTAAVDYQNASDYIDIAAGNRIMEVQGQSGTSTIALASDANNTVVIFPVVAEGASRFRNFQERFSYQSVPDTVASFRVISAGLDASGGGSATYDIGLVDETGALTAVFEGVAYRASSGYMAMEPGTYSMGVALSGTATVLATFDAVLDPGVSVTAVVFGDPSALVVASFFDMGVSPL